MIGIGVPIGIALAAGTGFALILLRGYSGSITLTELIALVAVVGASYTTLLVAVGGAAGLSIPLIAGLFVAVTSVLAYSAWQRHGTVDSENVPAATAPERRSDRLLLWLAIVLFVSKVLRFPLWSWDYYAIWGVKARRLITASGIDYSFLRLPGFAISNPSYPIGLPLFAQLVFLGQDVTTTGWKALHIAAGVALLFIVRATVRAGNGDAPGSSAWAAYASTMPLFWDTEAVGLAEVPLALLLAAAVFFVVHGFSRNRFDPVPLGICVGALPWVKSEGLTLAGYLLLILLFLFPARRTGWRRWILFSATVSLFTAAGVAVRMCCLGSGLSFFAGDWLQRMAGRTHEPMQIAGPLISDLCSWQWLGCWLVFGAGALIAAKRRARLAVAVAAVVICQLLTYGAVYFGSYIAPAEHIASSFHRIAAALSPMAIVSVALTLGDAAIVSIRRRR